MRGAKIGRIGEDTAALEVRCAMRRWDMEGSEACSKNGYIDGDAGSKHHDSTGNEDGDNERWYGKDRQEALLAVTKVRSSPINFLMARALKLEHHPKLLPFINILLPYIHISNSLFILVMSSHASLDAAAQARKNRLAQLKSLKRKQAPSDENDIKTDHTAEDAPREESPSVTTAFLSGRNYDVEMRAPKLGFEASPAANGPTLEDQAAAIAESTREQQAKEVAEDKPLDLFQLQPKKPNWDLKRDLQKKLDLLDVRTNNAIARLVKERIETQQKAKGLSGATSDGEATQLEGAELVEAMHLKEREEEEEDRKERELDAEDLVA